MKKNYQEPFLELKAFDVFADIILASPSGDPGDTEEGDGFDGAWGRWL